MIKTQMFSIIWHYPAFGTKLKTFRGEGGGALKNHSVIATSYLPVLNHPHHLTLKRAFRVSHIFFAPVKVAGSPSPSLNLIRFLSLFSIFIICTWEGGPTRQGGRIWGGLPERSSTKESYFVANVVLSWFTCFLKGFRRAFNESHSAFGELSTEVTLLLKSFRRAFNESHQLKTTHFYNCKK